MSLDDYFKPMDFSYKASKSCNLAHFESVRLFMRKIGHRKSFYIFITFKTCHPSYTDKILLRLTVWAPNGCQSEM